MLWATATVGWPEKKKKKKTVKVDQGEPTKDPPMIKSIFSLEHKDSEWVNSRTYFGWMKPSLFIESWEWVYLLETTNIVGDVWT